MSSEQLTVGNGRGGEYTRIDKAALFDNVTIAADDEESSERWVFLDTRETPTLLITNTENVSNDFDVVIDVARSTSEDDIVKNVYAARALSTTGKGAHIVALRDSDNPDTEFIFGWCKIRIVNNDTINNLPIGDAYIIMGQ